MLTNIKTPNLGVISVSKHVVSYFMEQIHLKDDTKAIEATLDALQSREIERLHFPSAIIQILVDNKEDPNGIEFWIHKESSTIFTVFPNDKKKHVDMAMKTRMDDFIFENE